MYRQRIMLELCHYVTSAAPWADHTGFVFRAALVVLLTAMLTASAFLGEPDNASEWKERLLKEAPRALAQLETYYAQSEGSYTQSERLPTAKGAYQKRAHKGRWIVNNDLFKCEITGPVATGATVINENYKARVKRLLKGSPAYALADLARSGPNLRDKRKLDDDEPGLDDFQRTQKKVLRAAVYAPCYFLDQPLSSRIPDLASRIQKAYSVTRDGKQLLRLDFVSAPLTGQWEPIFIVLNPNCFWCLEEYEAVQSIEQRPGQQLSMNCKVKLTYDPPFGGFPRLRQQELKIGTKGSHQPEIYVVDIESFRPRVAAPDEFTLAAYGLPEPVFAKPRTASLVYWSAAVVMAMATLLLILRHIKVKRESSA